MEEKKYTMDDLFAALKSPIKETNRKGLPNTPETWRRIGNKDPFTELGLGASELEVFLKEFIENNPYNNI
jgi:hypothetical protein